MAILEKFFFGCGHCHGAESCPAVEAAEQAAREGGQACRGARMVLPAITVFLLPMVTAIGGAHLSASWWAQATVESVNRWQAGGALAGLAVGVMMAKLIFFCAGLGKVDKTGASS